VTDGASVLIPTNRSSYGLVSFGTVMDFENAMKERTDADLIDVPAYSRRGRLRAAMRPRDDTFERVDTPRDAYDLCFFVAMEPSWISSLRYIDGLREKCARIVVYIFDAWLANERWLVRNRREWELCDVVYVSFPWAVDTYSRQVRRRVEYMPQAALASRFHPARTERPIDILSVGRRRADAHALLLDLAEKKDLFYFYSETFAPEAVELAESQQLLGRLCQSARSQVCWPVELTSPERAREGSPITARWFEAAASGSIVFGAKPGSTDFAEIFPYDRFVIALDPSDPPAFERRVLSALHDDRDWAERRSLASYVREWHSWEARCGQILEAVL
jgi:Glycosyl transferases group 1